MRPIEYLSYMWRAKLSKLIYLSLPLIAFCAKSDIKIIYTKIVLSLDEILKKLRFFVEIFSHKSIRFHSFNQSLKILFVLQFYSHQCRPPFSACFFAIFKMSDIIAGT